MAADSGPILQLALLGHGKMGKTVEQLAAARGFEIRLVLTGQSNGEGAGLTAANLQGVDVCIDFTAPSAVLENVRRVAAFGCNLVVGTTGWTEHLDEVRRIERIPVLGTGKTDYKQLRALVLEKAPGNVR